MSLSKTYIAIWCLLIAVFYSCNTEEGIAPADNSTFFKIIPGDGDNVPSQLIELSNGDLLIIANSNIFGEVTISKIRLIRMTPEGELVYDKRYPSTNESWSAIETVYLDDDNIIIGGSSNNSMLLFKVNANGDSLLYKNDYVNNPQFGSLTKNESNEVVALGVIDNVEDSIVASVSQVESTSLMMTSIQKNQEVAQIPSSNLLVSENIYGFAINEIVNYSYLNSEADLDEDAALSTADVPENVNLSVQFLANIVQTGRTIAFGTAFVEDGNGDISNVNLFSSRTEPAFDKNTYFAFNQPANTERSINSISVTDDAIYLSGATTIVGAGDNFSNYLLIKTDLSGRPDPNFNQSFGSSTQNNQMYHAIKVDNSIYAVGTTDFNDSQVAFMKLDNRGRLLK
jgi:hypothetical protein